MPQHLACVVAGLGVYLAEALLCSSSHATHVVSGGALFALGAAGVGLQGWHAVERLRAGVKGQMPLPPTVIFDDREPLPAVRRRCRSPATCPWGTRITPAWRRGRAAGVAERARAPAA